MFIKKVSILVNDNKKSLDVKKELEEKLINNGFIIDDSNYDLAIAVGGDGAFLRLVKENNFNSDIYYVGINSGTLGFSQEVAIEDIDSFIEELKLEECKVDKIAIEEVVITTKKGQEKHYALNEMIIRDTNLKVLKSDIMIENELIEHFCGDGVLVASSHGSTAHNLSFGGSIIYNNFTSLQLTPIAPINSKKYQSLANSIIVPRDIEIVFIPENKDLLLTIDGVNNIYQDVERIDVVIKNKEIKVLRFSNYNFSKKLREKLFIE